MSSHRLMLMLLLDLAAGGCRLGDLVGTPTQGRLAFGVQPSDAGVNQPIAPPIEVRVFDLAGAVDTAFTGAVTVTLADNPGGATLSGKTTTNAVRGVATFDQLHLDRPGAGYTLRAAGTDRAPVTSRAFAVTGSANAPPHAQIGAACANLACYFTDQSSDADGTVVSWTWDFGDGATSSARNPSHIYGTPDGYTVQLIVTDNAGAADTATRLVTVADANQAPTVRAGPDVSMTPGTFSLHAAFTDPDAGDAPWTYTIDWGDGSNPTGGATADQSSPITVDHGYLVPGQYQVRVTVTDKSGNSGSDDLIVTVTIT